MNFEHKFSVASSYHFIIIIISVIIITVIISVIIIISNSINLKFNYTTLITLFNISMYLNIHSDYIIIIFIDNFCSVHSD